MASVSGDVSSPAIGGVLLKQTDRLTGPASRRSTQARSRQPARAADHINLSRLVWQAAPHRPDRARADRATDQASPGR